MPTYTYRCHEHGRFDRSVPSRDRHQQVCTVCDEPGQRVFVAPHIAPLTGIPNRIDDEMLASRTKVMKQRDADIADVKAAEHQASRS